MNNDNNFNSQNQFGTQGNFNQPQQAQPYPQSTNQNMNQTTYNNGNINQNYNPNFNNQQVVNNYNQPVNQMVQNQPINNNYNPNQTAYVPSSPKNGIDKKIFIIGGIVLGIIALIILLLVINPFGGKLNKDSIKLYYDTEKPILIEDNEKYGFVSYDGKKITDIKYDYATEFYGEYAVVGIKENKDDYFASKYQVIDQKGKVKMDEILSLPEYDETSGYWELNSIIYDSKFKEVFKKDRIYNSIGYGYFTYIDVVKGESGILNHKGKTVFKWDNDYIYADIEVGSYDYDAKDIYAVIESDDDIEKILSLKTGKIIYTADNDDQYIYHEDNNLFSLNDYNSDEETFIYVKDGKIIHQVKGIYDVEVYDPENGILELNYGYDVDRDERYKYYDAINKKNIEILSNDEMNNILYSYMEKIYGYRIFSNEDIYGLIKGDEIVLSGDYTYIDLLDKDVYNFIKEEYGKELFIFESRDKFRIIDVKEKREVVSFNTYSVETDESTFVFADITENYSTIRYDVYNLVTGKMKEFDKDADIELYSNYITVTTDEKIEYYNVNLEKVYEIVLEKEESIIEEPESSWDEEVDEDLEEEIEE